MNATRQLTLKSWLPKREMADWMAVVTVSLEELSKMSKLGEREVLEGLSNLGMPSEAEGDELFVEVTPNRPDLFSIEGITRALGLFYRKKRRMYRVKKSGFKIKTDASVGKQRPFIVSAVVKNVGMDERVLESMIQLQEKLHETIGRKRRKVAIGLHNAREVAFPLTYRFVQDAHFVPLDFSSEMNVAQLLEKHPKGVAYRHLVGPLYPMLYDQKGVISFPPIINSERTRVTEHTRDLVVEATGTHLPTLSGALNIVVCALADRGGEAYAVSVDGVDYPDLAPKKMKLDFDGMNGLLGEEFSKKEIFAYLGRLGWTNDGKTHASPPPYRVDVTHHVDAAEDVAIAHGYNEFAPSTPDFFTSGSLLDVDFGLRSALLRAGFVEVVNYALTNEPSNKKTGGTPAIKIINQKTEEFTLMRTGLAGGLLQNIAANKAYELPIRIFELGRVYASVEKNHAAFAISSESVDFSAIRGVVQALARDCGFAFEYKESGSQLFAEGRGADIIFMGKQIGFAGEISPPLLESFGVENPVALCELDLSLLKRPTP